MHQATTISQTTFNIAAVMFGDDVHCVGELNGFKKGDRIAVTDVVSSPAQVYCGEIEDLHSDGFACVKFDHALTWAAEQNIKTNGRVNLHWAIHE